MRVVFQKAAVGTDWLDVGLRSHAASPGGTAVQRFFGPTEEK
jgi:hypothetical protein